jgi:hypothetical protein
VVQVQLGGTRHFYTAQLDLSEISTHVPQHIFSPDTACQTDKTAPTSSGEPLGGRDRSTKVTRAAVLRILVEPATAPTAAVIGHYAVNRRHAEVLSCARW